VLLKEWAFGFLLFGEVHSLRCLFQSNLNHIHTDYLLFIWDVTVLFLNITALKLWSRNNIWIKEFIVFIQSQEKRTW